MFVSQRELAHGIVLPICEVEVSLDRSLENLRRVESVVGPAALFAARLDARGATQTDIVRVYRALLRGVPDAPSERDVESWVFKVGSRHPDLAIFVYSLTLSSDELDAVVAARNLAAGRPVTEDDEQRPFGPMGGPTGRSSSGSDTGAGSLRERFSRLHSSN